jgi:ribosomal protein L22
MVNINKEQFKYKFSPIKKIYFFEMLKIASVGSQNRSTMIQLTILLIWLILAALLNCSIARADTPLEAKQSNVANKIKLMLDPIRGLNLEIKNGLQKIEQTCDLISKSKLTEAKQAASNSADARKQVFIKDLTSAKQLALEQNIKAENFLSESQTRVELNLKSCESNSKSNMACKDLKEDKELVDKVSKASSFYYSEALARLSSYSRAFELEQNGCTRPGFAFRLWSAEREHLLPTLKTSADSFADLLN